MRLAEERNGSKAEVVSLNRDVCSRPRADVNQMLSDWPHRALNQSQLQYDRMNAIEDKPLPAVGVYWVKEEDYSILLEIFEDGNKLATFLEGVAEDGRGNGARP